VRLLWIGMMMGLRWDLILLLSSWLMLILLCR
jgi:hypothetical protein